MPQTVRIASWNINSVRARVDIVERFLREEWPLLNARLGRLGLSLKELMDAPNEEKR